MRSIGRALQRSSVLRILGAGMLAAVGVGVGAGCSRHVVRVTGEGGTVTSSVPVYARETGDTLIYVVSFASPEHRQEFVGMLERLLSRYQLSAIQRDSVSSRIFIRVLPIPDTGRSGKSPPAVMPDTVSEGPDGIFPQLSQPVIVPRTGGAIVIYSEREFWDDYLGSLANAFMGTEGTWEHGDKALVPVTVRQVSPTRVTITLAPGLRNYDGKTVTAFEVASHWTAFIQEQPDEGIALFGNVRGVLGFLRGEEKTVPGFIINGNESLTLVFEESDPEALTRLTTPRLLPPSLKLGPYVVAEKRGASEILAANRQNRSGPPYLDRCTVVFGRDRNPLVSYSLRKYDCVLLTAKKDIEYARRTMGADSRMIPLPGERYFLSVNAPTTGERLALRALVDPGRILRAVGCEGEVLESIEHSYNAVVATGGGEPPSAPIKIVYRRGDPVSSRIAENLMAMFTAARLTCTVAALDGPEYGRTLVERNYTLAIGWVGEQVTTDRAERLRLAAIWFGGNRDESQRITEGLEIPLFTVRRHLLCRANVGFAGDSLAEVFVLSEPQGKEQDHRAH